MSTEDTTEKPSDVPAVTTQTLRPASATNQAVAGYKLLRSQVLVWFGILGGVLTVFSNFGKVLTLSNWARWLVTHWHDWLHTVWSKVFSLIDVSIEREDALVLSYLLFVLSMSVGLWLRGDRTQKRVPESFFQTPTAKLINALFISSVCFWIIVIGAEKIEYFKHFSWLERKIAMLLGPAIAVGVYWASVSEAKLKTFAAYLLLTSFAIVIVIIPLGEQFESVSSLLTMLFLLKCGLFFSAIIAYTPIDPLLSRLSFIAVGLAIMISLNEISRHDLSFFLQPPK